MQTGIAKGLTLMIRADSSVQMGTGHLMRCFALAEEWRVNGGRVVFAAHRLTQAVANRLADSSFQHVPVDSTSQSTREAADSVKADWVVVDLGEEADEHLRELKGIDTLVVDDIGRSFRNRPTLVVNQNRHAPKVSYKGLDSQSLLLGLDYVLLRDEILAARRQPHLLPMCSDLLLAMGGTDPMRLTEKLAVVLASAFEGTVHVLLSGSHPSLGSLSSFAGRSYRIKVHVDVSDVGSIMASADLAVSAGGTTVWELAYLGVPVLVGSTGPAEDLLIGGLRDVPFAQVLGRFEDLDQEHIASVALRMCEDLMWREAANAQGQLAIDGYGRRRILKAMVDPSSRERE